MRDLRWRIGDGTTLELREDDDLYPMWMTSWMGSTSITQPFTREEADELYRDLGQLLDLMRGPDGSHRGT